MCIFFCEYTYIMEQIAQEFAQEIISETINNFELKKIGNSLVLQFSSFEGIIDFDKKILILDVVNIEILKRTFLEIENEIKEDTQYCFYGICNFFKRLLRL